MKTTERKMRTMSDFNTFLKLSIIKGFWGFGGHTTDS